MLKKTPNKIEEPQMTGGEMLVERNKELIRDNAYLQQRIIALQNDKDELLKRNRELREQENELAFYQNIMIQLNTIRETNNRILKHMTKIYLLIIFLITMLLGWFIIEQKKPSSPQHQYIFYHH